MDNEINIDIEKNFIKELADYTEKNFIKHGSDMSKIAFVFGGKRPALFMKKELSTRLGRGFFPPRFFSADEFVEYTLSKKKGFSKVRDLDASFIIYKLAQKIAPDILKGRESFSQFLGWAQEVLKFIEAADQEDIQVKSLENIQFKAEIGYDVPENINKLLESIIALRSAFHSKLEEKNEFSRGLMYLKASEYIDKADFSEFDVIAFCGFFYLHNTENRIIKSLCDSKKAVFISQGKPGEWAAQAKEDNISIYAGFDAHSQACLAREIIKKTKNLDKTVVVLPDSQNLIPLLSELASCVKDFNVSMGYPLNRSSLYSLFECIFKAQEMRDNGKYYSKDYLNALTHPLIKGLKLFQNQSAARVVIHKIEEAILGIERTSLSGSLFIKPSQVEDSVELLDMALESALAMGIAANRDEIKNVIKRLNRILFIAWESIDNFYDFSQALEVLMDELAGKSFLGSYPLNLKMAEKIFSIKEELENASFKDEAFPQDDIFKIFRAKLNAEKISFTGSPLKGLQVLGLFETRSLNFENVIIMDVNESVLPSLKIYEPLIPREVMIGLGLNRLEKDEEIQRYHFRRLIESAKNVHLIYQDTPEKEKSRFIEEIIWQKEKALKKIKTVQIPRASFSVKVMPKKIEIEKNAQVVNFLKSLEYSASSINTYLHCPLKFYYQYVLGLKEKEDLLDEPEGADIGTFIHELFEKTFGVFLGKRPVIDAEFKDMFFKALDKKFENEFKKKLKSDAFLVKEILDVRLERFLESESKRQVRRILSLEKTFKGRLKLACGEFAVKAIVDRIDMLDNESLLVIDYKTGSSDIMPSSNVEKIKSAGFSREAAKNSVKSFQLPIYLHLVSGAAEFKGREANAALYFIKEPGIEELKGSLMDVYMQALDGVMSGLLNPDTPFKADLSSQQNCSYCPFFYLCR